MHCSYRIRMVTLEWKIKILVSALELREPKGCMDMAFAILDNIFATLFFYPFQSEYCIGIAESWILRHS